MTIGTRKTRNGETRLFIEIRYETVDGARKRFRRDAQVQTKYGARAEERRLLLELAKTGTIGRSAAESQQDVDEQPSYTFADAVREFRRMKLPTLKHSTGFSYNHRLNELLLPRFGALPLTEVDGNALRELDALLVGEKLSPSTRRNMQIVVRSVLSFAVETGNLTEKPKLPRLPKAGKKVISPIRESDLQLILGAASTNARTAFMLAAYAGLRAGEVRGLQWSDIDLKGSTLTVRRAISRNEATTPKSGHQRLVPLTPTLVKLLSSIPKEGPGHQWRSQYTGRSGEKPGSTKPSSGHEVSRATQGGASTTCGTSSARNSRAGEPLPPPFRNWRAMQT